jgi:hypothetical protein
LNRIFIGSHSLPPSPVRRFGPSRTELVIGLQRHDHPHRASRAAPSCAQGQDTHRTPRVDLDGWQQVERWRVHPQDCRERPPQPEAPLWRCFPRELYGRCLNSLSFKHQVASCWQPSRCLCCHGLRHRAKDCTRPHHPPPPPLRSSRHQPIRVIHPVLDERTSSTTTAAVGEGPIRRTREGGVNGSR